MEYNFRDIEKKWQQKWIDDGIYKVSNKSDKPKYYVLDMFPYPSGAGLHVGHPLGYIASDIYARYKRLKGFNVLHPMGYDAFGLPAEQYAIENGVHPAESTAKNIATFRSQLDKIGFCYDWSREVNTSNPKYYKWTQWIFLQLFKSWYNRKTNKTEHIVGLIKIFEEEGNAEHPIPSPHPNLPPLGEGTATAQNQKNEYTFSAAQWHSFDEKTKQAILMEYRIIYCGYGEVNWCEALGTVLANDEVVNGVSERGGYPVEKKRLRQWYLRITEYADRLLQGLQTVDFSEAMKEMQSNWIGKSSGAEIKFKIQNSKFKIEVYTTRPDTIFGVDFMVLAPEHELVEKITSEEQKKSVEEYIAYVKSRSERERMAEKKITGVFTGAYAINPFNLKQIPIWISEYVLAGYGTGAIMAVPSGDERDHKFAKHFNLLPITNIIGDAYNGEEANATKDVVLSNSDFLNGMVMRDAIEIVISKIEELGIGKRKVNYKMHDAAFSRQRYWGEPFPIKWINGIAYPLDESKLPLELPHVESYKPSASGGEGPLANIPEWKYQKVKLDLSESFKVSSVGGDLEEAGAALETNTMPGYAGSSWYFLRYMDPHNDKEFCDKKISDYWRQVDLYVGGTEHAVGHLLYSRMWTKALYDLGLISFDEPFKKLLNQGMIQGSSQIAYVRKGDFEEGVSVGMSNTVFVPGFSNPSSTPKPKLQLYSADVITEQNKSYFKPFNIPIELVRHNPADPSKNILDIELGIKLYPQRLDAIYIVHKAFYYEGVWRTWNEKEATWSVTENQTFYTDGEVEKMSKSKYNVVNPDDIILKYGADTFRMYEMFLGPVEMSKPWDTKGIEGVHRFLKKLWRLFFLPNAQAGDEQKGAIWTEGEAATPEELKILHRTIKKIEEDTERFSYNTAVSAFMVCVNELTDIKCHKKEILEPLLILLAPYAPHIAEELYQQLESSKVSPVGGDLEGAWISILNASFPKPEEKYLIESVKEYPISINGKLRTTISIDLNATQPLVEEIVLAHPVVQKWLDGKPPKKIIFVRGKMVNVVI